MHVDTKNNSIHKHMAAVHYYSESFLFSRGLFEPPILIY